MADRFLREVKRMHQLRRDINEITPEEADELIRGKVEQSDVEAVLQAAGDRHDVGVANGLGARAISFETCAGEMTNVPFPIH